MLLLCKIDVFNQCQKIIQFDLISVIDRDNKLDMFIQLGFLVKNLFQFRFEVSQILFNTYFSRIHLSDSLLYLLRIEIVLFYFYHQTVHFLS